MKTLELNKIHLGNCLELLKQLEDESIDLIITSPPYNLGSKTDSKNGRTHSSIHYDVYKDDKEEEDYRQFELAWLEVAYQKLKPGGSLFYNHKERNRGGVAIRPDEWLYMSPFTHRQQIIWDRGGTLNTCGKLCSSQKEYIYWMTKPDKKGFVRINKEKFLDEKGKLIGLSDIWRFAPDRKNSHPAPFPQGLPNRCLNLIIGQPKKKNADDSFVVLDPFFGSGTVGLSAIKYGVSWIGFDLSENYKKMAEERIENYKKTLKPIENDSIWD